MAGKLNKSIRGKAFMLEVISLLLLAVIMSIVGVNSFTGAFVDKVHEELSDEAAMVRMLMDEAYPGDYRVEVDDKNETYTIYKGDVDITEEYELLDYIKSEVNVEITIFCGETRVMTTLMDDEGERYLLSVASSIVREEVLKDGNIGFYDDVKIGDTRNYAYYEQIQNDDDVVFMIGISKSQDKVDKLIRDAVIPILFVAVFVTILIGVCGVKYATSMVESIMDVHKFMKSLSAGEFNVSLQQKTISRDDELGDLAKIGLQMQSSLRQQVEQDVLTKMNNRRYGDKRLQQMMDRYEESGEDYCVAIGDIDLFKKVNDTYGHEAGDIVLKKTAEILKNHLAGNGFVARWGGEEFLMVLENNDIRSSVRILDKMLDELRDTTIVFGDNKIHVTMSIGVTKAESEYSIDEILQLADANLYKAKESGRDRIVY